MAQTVFLTGGTGFVGTEILEQLIDAGYAVRALARDSEDLAGYGESVTAVPGDVMDPETYIDAMRGADAVIHLVGIIREVPKKGVTFEKLHHEATIHVVDTAKRAGVKRYLQMSANGVREDATSEYHKTKWEAEEYVRASGLDWTIFRPSVIYGPEDSFINMLAGFIRYTPMFSYFGKGDYPMQPVSVFEVGEVFVKSLSEPKTVGKTFGVCGSEVFTYKELLKLISRVLDSTTVLFPVPEMFVRAGIGLFGKTQWFPITEDQFTMLVEGNTCENREIFDLLGIEGRSMEETVGSYLD